MSLLQISISIFSLLHAIVISSDSPIIGILTIPCVSEPHYCSDTTLDHNATSFFYASYVKWIESGGGRVVPIQSDMAHDEVRNLLSQLNGVLFTGGSASLNISTSIYFQQVANIMDYLLEYSSTNEAKAIPLWATCLGFEAITVYIANNHSVLTRKYAEDIALPIHFTSDAPDSTVFGAGTMPQEYVQSVYNKLATENLTMNFHKYGVDPSVWETNQYLKGNMSLVASSMDANGTWFGTLQESKNKGENNTFQYIYASQFHPEKPPFIFDAKNESNHIPHSLDAIYTNQYFAEFFVNECRLRNDNQMSRKLYEESVIYNYVPFWYKKGKKSPEELYWFSNPNIKTTANKTHTRADTHSKRKRSVVRDLLLSMVGAFMIVCVAGIAYCVYRWKHMKSKTAELAMNLNAVAIEEHDNDDSSEETSQLTRGNITVPI